jgi:hypothetical protein
MNAAAHRTHHSGVYGKLLLLMQFLNGTFTVLKNSRLSPALRGQINHAAIVAS